MQFILVMYFASTHGMPSVTTFPDLESCMIAREVIATEYLPDFRDEPAWSNNANRHRSLYEMSQCLSLGGE